MAEDRKVEHLVFPANDPRCHNEGRVHLGFRRKRRSSAAQVRKLVKKVGEGMLADPEVGPKMREPLKAKLYRIDPGVKIFRCKFQTAPGHQFDVRAQAYRRIEAALKDAGIRFAAGIQTVLLPPPPMERFSPEGAGLEGA